MFLGNHAIDVRFEAANLINLGSLVTSCDFGADDAGQGRHGEISAYVESAITRRGHVHQSPSPLANSVMLGIAHHADNLAGHLLFAGQGDMPSDRRSVAEIITREAFVHHGYRRIHRLIPSVDVSALKQPHADG